MSIKSTFSLSDDNYLMNLMDNAELSSDISFEDFKKPNRSSITAVSTSSSSCKYYYIILNFLFFMIYSA